MSLQTLSRIGRNGTCAAHACVVEKHGDLERHGQWAVHDLLAQQQLRFAYACCDISNQLALDSAAFRACTTQSATRIMLHQKRFGTDWAGARRAGLAASAAPVITKAGVIALRACCRRAERLERRCGERRALESWAPELPGLHFHEVCMRFHVAVLFA
jgi:hypothetical protein